MRLSVYGADTRKRTSRLLAAQDGPTDRSRVRPQEIKGPRRAMRGFFLRLLWVMHTALITLVALF